MSDVYKLRESLKFVLDHEGGYVNNPSDLGGETKWGISKRAYPNLDIKNLTPQQALDIYTKDYWLPIGGDNIPYPMCVVAMDSAVTCGVHRTLVWMQDPDGQTWQDLLNMRKAFMLRRADQPGQRVFLRGWLNRISDLQKYCDVNDDSQT
jgi:lysozyme family protein